MFWGNAVECRNSILGVGHMSSTAWEDLTKHHKTWVDVKMADLFAVDKQRFSQFSLRVGDLLLDYSKQRLTTETRDKLCRVAEESNLFDHVQAMFRGENLNISEQRPALHTALRDPSQDPIFVEGQNIKPRIHESLSRIETFVGSIRSGKHLGVSDKRITDIISLGIGGSDLGPSMVCQALSHYKTTDIRLHFISNIDGRTMSAVLEKCDPASTLCIINSKTFTTPETLQNAKHIQAWFKKALGQECSRHLIGVTANCERARAFGLLEENIFEFWDFVGGRYSVWSSVGLPIALFLGMSHFRSFLEGAYEMDKHFYSAPFSENMPVLMALIGIWNINFWNCQTQAIIPYDDGLKQFPDYLQQLEMESNGKRAHLKTGFVTRATAPIIWGGVGCNGQHAYMQLLHQGTQVVPVDFLIATTGPLGFDEHHQLLFASCLSQSKALMEGNVEDVVGDPLIDAKLCSGNRPSSTLLYPELTPRILGSLIALYEHKVFVQGVLWGINSFDQWGVELGKKLVKQILPYIKNNLEGGEGLDSSTKGLVQHYKRAVTKSLEIL